MEKTLRYAIEKIIMKKYPVITGIESITDLLNRTYIDLNTSECLDSETMMEIDTEIKNLFISMGLGINNSFSFRKPSVVTFFDCGDGTGPNFISSYGYKHI